MVLIVGGLPGAGATATITNLAVSIAGTDTNILVIDANLRRPRLHALLGAGEHPGLSEVLRAESSLEDAVVRTKVANLSLLPAGRRDAHIYERFVTPAMHAIFEQARREYDIVLVDAPPAVVSSDVIALAAHADATVLVVKALSEKRGLVARLRNQLSDCRAEFLGVVVNGVKASAGGYFRRNFQVTHEYGRGGDESLAGVAPISANGSLAILPPAVRETTAQVTPRDN